MKQAIGYIRVSTERQAKEGASLEAQRARIEDWCRRNGCELVEVFADEGISGATMKGRPGLQAALAALKKGRVLVTYALSRLARSTKDALFISEAVAAKKSDLVSLTEQQFDTTTAAGRLMFQMMAALAEFERSLIAERTSSTLQHLKKTGRKFSGIAPFGFEAVEGRLVQVQQEAAVVAEIHVARQQGRTLQSIADDLNSRSVPTKTGKQWQPATIHYLLKRSALVSAC
ncbi:MAG TPA: recombinase family protein [Acidimicrobiales bacterium]|nr:recombinase family protein [Acidimicrobiales bacterium]